MIIALLCVVSCNIDNETEETIYEREHNADIEIWTDKETGVQYIIYDKKDGYGGMGGITPRLNADGTPYIGE